MSQESDRTKIIGLDLTEITLRAYQEWLRNHTHFLLKNITTGVAPEVNVCDFIANTCGWNPLEPGEKMSVGYGGKRYSIQRTDNIPESERIPGDGPKN